MADLSDVLNALVSVIDAAIYPNGDASPSAIVVGGASITAKVYPGWPTGDQLDADLRAGRINISVFAPPGMERNTTRYPRVWQQQTAPVQTLTLSISGTSVTVGGTFAAAVAQNVALIVDDVAYAYSCRSTDSLSTIAAALAALVNADQPASSTGPLISIPGATAIIGRVGGFGEAIEEVSRQDRLFQISFWCPPAKSGVSAIRDAAVKLVDPALRQMQFIPLADGTGGRLIYRRTHQDDGMQKAGCYRRDLFYTIEYGTTITEEVAEAIVITTNMQGSAAPTVTPADPPPLVFNA